MQINENNVPTVDQYLSIIRDFMLQIHEKLALEDSCNIFNHSDVEILKKGSVKLKTYKDHIIILQGQIKELQEEKSSNQSLRDEQNHLQKRLTQKVDEITILRQTIKKLYSENEHLNIDKQQLFKQLSNMKENYNMIRKKYKRQEDQISTHRVQLQKLTNTAEERLNEYLKDDKENQSIIIIKKITAELEKVKADLIKKEKTLNNMTKKNQDLKQIQCDYQQTLALMETLKYQNKLLKQQIQSAKLNNMQQNHRIIAQRENLVRQWQKQQQKNTKLLTANKHLQLQIHTQQQRVKGYEQEIVMRTQKLKEKSKQIKTYNEQISTLVKKVQQLSGMSDCIIDENRQLNLRCQAFEKQLEQMKGIHAYIDRMKGNLNYKKSLQLGKMIESLSKLQNQV